MRHEIAGPRGLAVIEEQDIVYRGETDAAARAADSPSADPSSLGGRASERGERTMPAWSQVIIPTPAMVFRYSAITFNAHRIHYDLPYTRDVEGYPGLVVNGGLTTLLVWHAAARAMGRAVAASATRNLQPLFVDRPISIAGGTLGANGTLRVTVSNDLGQAALEADLQLAEARS